MSIFNVSQHEPRTIEWWFEQAQAGRLDMDPDFQRRSGLWSRYKQAHLIDSVLNGYDIPKFYVADFNIGRSRLNLKSKPYAVVDGKQRFAAIFSFLEGNLPLNRSTTFEANPDLSIEGMKYGELAVFYPELVKKLLNFKPVVMSIVTDDDKKISEMFVRLNSGEAANSAERRNAQPGPIPEIVRELVGHAFFRNRISFSTKRMADMQLAAKLLLIEFRGCAVDTKAKDLDKFVREAARETTPPAFEEMTDANKDALARYESAAGRVTEVLEYLADAFEEKDKLLSASGRIPIYYLVLRDYPQVVDNFRDFVMDFEGKVIRAMRAAREGEESGEGFYATYYTLSRTGNDQKSMRERYKMMVGALRKRNLI